MTAVILAVIAGVLPYFFGPLFAEDDELGHVVHLELELHRLIDVVRNEKTSAKLMVLGAGVGIFVAWHYGADWVQYMVAGGFSGMSAVGVNEVGKRFMEEMKTDE